MVTTLHRWLVEAASATKRPPWPRKPVLLGSAEVRLIADQVLRNASEGDPGRDLRSVCHHVELKVVVLEVTAECPVTDFGKDAPGPVEPNYALDLPHQVGNDASADLPTHGGVERLIKVVSKPQPTIAIEPVILPRNGSIQFILQHNRKVVCNLRLGCVNDSSHRSPASLTLEMERVYARTQSIEFHVDEIFNDPSNLLWNAAAQWTDGNIWVPLVIFQPLTDPVEQDGTD